MDRKTIRRRHQLWTGLGLGLILLAGFFLFSVISGPALFIDAAQKRGSVLLGRDFTIAGPFNIDWDWRAPRIHAEQVRLANTQGAAEPYTLEIGKADFTIKIWKLLIGRIEIPEIRLEQPRLVLEKTDETHKNWDLPFFSQGRMTVQTVIPENRHDFPVIGKAQIYDGFVSYKDTVGNMDLKLTLNTAQGQSGENENLEISGDGTLQGQAFKIDAAGGSIDLLRDSSRPFPLDITIAMGPTTMKMEGTFHDLVKMNGVSARLDVKGNNMADLFYLTGIPLPPTPPYTLTGLLERKDDVWVFRDFAGMVGDSDLGGELAYDTSGERGLVKANLVSKRMDLDDLGGFIGAAPDTGAGETAAPEQKQQARQEEASPFLLPDTPINLDRLRAADMDVTLKAEKLEEPGLPFKGMDVRFHLDQGFLRIEPMALVLADGTASGYLTLDGRRDVPAVNTSVDVKNMNIARFFEGTQFEEESKGEFGGHIELAGNGVSLDKILADSDGQITFIMQGGQVSLLMIEAADVDLAEAVPLLLGDDESTRVHCGVGDFRVEDGILYSTVFVLDTDDTNLSGRADINLRQESIDAAIDAHPKDSSLLSLQTPITVTGSLKDPVVGLEPVDTGLRATGAAVLGVLLTPVAAILPFIGTGGGEDSDCQALIAQAQSHIPPSSGED